MYALMMRQHKEKLACSNKNNSVSEQFVLDAGKKSHYVILALFCACVDRYGTRRLRDTH